MRSGRPVYTLRQALGLFASIQAAAAATSAGYDVALQGPVGRTKPWLAHQQNYDRRRSRGIPMGPRPGRLIRGAFASLNRETPFDAIPDQFLNRGPRLRRQAEREAAAKPAKRKTGKSRLLAAPYGKAVQS